LDAHAVVPNILQISKHGVDLRDCLNLPSTASFFARSGRCKDERLFTVPVSYPENN